MRRISEKTKLREGRGTGTGADYEPYIKVSDFGSEGTCSNPIDWKNGRIVHLLSQGEAILWHLLRWDERNVDIQEQFPLHLEETLRLCDQYGIRHPHNRSTPMTTDFLVTQKGGIKLAFSLKSSRTEMDNPRTVQKLFIEKQYWMAKHVPFQLTFKEDLNVIFYNNIRQVVEYYSAKSVHDDISVLKHLIATRKINPLNMNIEILNYPKLLHTYEREIELWKKYKSKSE